MSEQDDLQKLWQDEMKREGSTMWKELIKEKQTAWNELVRAEDQTWYLIALAFVPLTALAAWKAKYPWVHIGYALMAATIAISALATWILGNRHRREHDRNLREHLQALIESYDARSRFTQRLGWCAMGGLTLGVSAVLLGIPGNVSSLTAWIITLLAVAGANVAQWLLCKQAVGKIYRKRAEAGRLLEALVGGGRGLR